MEKSKVKIVIFVPVEHADNIRKVAGDNGAGKIGNYSHCSFSSIGTGRFLPLENSSPSIGSVGNFESVQEERIEFVCEIEKAKDVIEAIRKVHPYEEMAYDVYPLLDL